MKIAPDQRAEVSRRYLAGERVDALAAHYGVTSDAIYRVLRRMGAKRPALRGSQHPAAKLTEDAVREIRARAHGGRLSAEDRVNLAVWFGVSPSTLDMIAAGRGWKHVAPEG